MGQAYSSQRVSDNCRDRLHLHPGRAGRFAFFSPSHLNMHLKISDTKEQDTPSRVAHFSFCSAKNHGISGGVRPNSATHCYSKTKLNWDQLDPPQNTWTVHWSFFSHRQRRCLALSYCLQLRGEIWHHRKLLHPHHLRTGNLSDQHPVSASSLNAKLAHKEIHSFCVSGNWDSYFSDCSFSCAWQLILQESGFWFVLVLRDSVKSHRSVLTTCGMYMHSTTENFHIMDFLLHKEPHQKEQRTLPRTSPEPGFQILFSTRTTWQSQRMQIPTVSLIALVVGNRQGWGSKSLLIQALCHCVQGYCLPQRCMLGIVGNLNLLPPSVTLTGASSARVRSRNLWRARNSRWYRRPRSARNIWQVRTRRNIFKLFVRIRFYTWYEPTQDLWSAHPACSATRSPKFVPKHFLSSVELKQNR